MKVGEEDKVEIYRAFYEQMVKFGYSLEYIGMQLAFIARAADEEAK
ncbi:hypothetical protein LCGC14_1400660 [marine sediment metagenome]|uniref:Uncharacterized protein n=1 Tax=marine sediment metagenome TaxID=412755 RepID=A0A0F9MCR9_9ZZZZ